MIPSWFPFCSFLLTLGSPRIPPDSLLLPSGPSVQVAYPGEELEFGRCYSFDATNLAPIAIGLYPALAPSPSCVGGGSCGSVILTGRCPERPSPPPSPPLPPSPPTSSTFRVTATFVAAGFVEEYPPSVTSQMAAVFANELGVPSETVTVIVAAGSVIVTVSIAAQTASQATSMSTVLNRPGTGLLSSASRLNAALSGTGAGAVNSVDPAVVVEANAGSDSDNTGYLITIVVLAVAAAVATAVAIWALNNKYHARPIFHPIFQTTVPPPSTTTATEMQTSAKSAEEAKV